MEANTVVISIDRYEEFKLAEKKVNEPRSKTIVIERHMMGSYVVETDDECTEKLAKDLKDAKEEIDKLKDELKNPKKEEDIKITIDDVREMNYWDFRKWKRS